MVGHICFSIFLVDVRLYIGYTCGDGFWVWLHVPCSSLFPRWSFRRECIWRKVTTKIPIAVQFCELYDLSLYRSYTENKRMNTHCKLCRLYFKHSLFVRRHIVWRIYFLCIFKFNSIIKYPSHKCQLYVFSVQTTLSQKEGACKCHSYSRKELLTRYWQSLISRGQYENEWNILPAITVSAPTLDAFRSLLVE